MRDTDQRNELQNKLLRVSNSTFPPHSELPSLSLANHVLSSEFFTHLNMEHFPNSEDVHGVFDLFVGAMERVPPKVLHEVLVHSRNSIREGDLVRGEVKLVTLFTVVELD